MTELFLALRMFDEEMGPEGEDLRLYLSVQSPDFCFLARSQSR